MSNFRAHVGPALAGALTAFTLLLAGSVAGAQSPATNAPAPLPVSTSQATPALNAPYWALIGGYEWDTHGSSYGFFGPAYVHPIRPAFAWTARVFGNYLSYEFSDLTTSTRVKSPGASGAVGLQWGEKHTFGLSVGPAVSWRRTTVKNAAGVQTSDNTETRLGVNVGGALNLNPSPANNIQVLVNYNPTDKYTWSRIGAKTQISNRSWSGPNAWFIGAEGIAQGNGDIRSTQIGGLIELNHTPAKLSVMFRAGYKRSTFDVGPAKTGPYFGIGFYKRLN